MRTLREALLPKQTEPEAAELQKPPLGPKRGVSHARRMERYIEGLATSAEMTDKQGSKEVAGCLRMAAPAISGLMRVAVLVAPFYMAMYKRLYQLYKLLPKHAASMVFGGALCFFGGTFAASIAAVEAARTMGLQRVYADLHVVLEQVRAAHDRRPSPRPKHHHVPAELMSGWKVALRAGVPGQEGPRGGRP